jgi:lipid A 3-O-deacylase
MRKVFLLFFCLLFINSGTSVFAQSSWIYKDEFGFKSDNDSYLAQGSDRYYTNGLFLTFRHAMDQRKVYGKINKKIWEIEAGQRMYNAQSGNVPDITYVDRPFAAYLYVGGSKSWLYTKEHVLKISAQIGAMGPSAKGKEAQELLHKTFGFYEINGWQYQVNNAIGINTSMEYSRFIYRTGGNKLDLSAVSNLNLGTTYTNAGIGALIRMGSISQFFHSAISNSRVSNQYVTQPLAEREFFFFARPVLTAIGYDATIQGGLFKDNKGPVTYDVKRLVFSTEAGIMYAYKRITADFTATFKSKEIESPAKKHQYGSASLYYRFN